MTFPSGLDISRGLGQGVIKIHRFGRNFSVGNVFEPISIGGIYRTPQVGNQTTLRVKAGGNANDTFNGSGAQSITIVGLNEFGVEIKETIPTNGASASLPTQQTFLRIHRAYVEDSGSYATQAIGSHAAAIVIENGSGGTDWATINNETVARGITQISTFSVPLRLTAFIANIKITSNSDKAVNLILLERQNILQTSPPYSSMRVVEEFPQIAGLNSLSFDPPLGPFPPLTDVGFMGRSSISAAEVSVSYEVIEVLP